MSAKNSQVAPANAQNAEFAAPTGAEVMRWITEALAEIHRQGQGGYADQAQLCKTPGQS